MDRSGHSGVVDGRTAVRMDTDGDYTDGGSNFQVLRGATTVRPPTRKGSGPLRDVASRDDAKIAGSNVW